MRPKLKICLALIHNQDTQRLSYIRPKLKILSKELSSKFEVEIFEVFQQPQIKSMAKYLNLTVRYIYWRINREFEDYKKNKSRNIIFDFLILIARFFLSRQDQRYVIEAYIADKHIRAWSHFLERNSQFLICFEDDVIFKRDSISRIKKLLLNTKIDSRNKLLYIDLAGGNNMEIMNAKMIEQKRDSLGIHFKKPITNTACCYLINKNTGRIFIEKVFKNPWLRLICADWMMNKVFISSVNKEKYFCLHTYPSIFSHGSITGNYSSMYDDLKSVN